MILYSKSTERTQIFNNIQSTTQPRLYKFEAIDTINNWDYWKNYAINNNLTTNTYINKIRDIYGKLGCNLSHQMLIKHIYENDDDIKWLMIMEDDIELINYSADEVDKLIDKAEELNSHYIQLFINKNHKIHQSRAEQIDENLKLYKMIPQWGTVCYLIDRVGMKAVIDNFPVSTNMDYLYNNLITELNSLCYLGDTFGTCGTMDSQDDTAPLGSLIWKKNVIKKDVNNDEKPKQYYAEVAFNNIENNIYIFPSYLVHFLKETVSKDKYTINRIIERDEYKQYLMGNSFASFVTVNPYAYLLINFVINVLEDRQKGLNRYVIPKTNQLLLGKWIDNNKVSNQYEIAHGANYLFPIDLDELIYKINSDSITNLSNIDSYLKKIIPGCPNVETISNHPGIKKYVEDRFKFDFKTYNYKNETVMDLVKKNEKHALHMAKFIDPDPNNHIYKSLWIGNELSNMEKLSIKSFIDNGHIFHLYTYGEVKGIPKGTIIKDGNDILDKSEIFTYKNGSYSAFSNLFRFTLLYKKGGYWVDTDFVCLKPMYFPYKYAIASEPNENYTEQLVTSCLLKLPKGSPEAEEGIRIQREHKAIILSGAMTWSSGPKSVKEIVDKFDLNNFVIEWRQICSCFCHHSRSLIDPGYYVGQKGEKQITELGTTYKLNNMMGIHLWHECWRRNNMSKDAEYSEDSIYGKLCKRFLTTDIRKIEDKVKVIYVVSRQTYLTKMSRVRFHGINAFLKMENTELIYTGIGWDNYNIDLNIHENLENIKNTYRWNDINYVIGYKPLDIPGYADIKYPKVIRYNEMYDIEWTLKEIWESGSDIVICHHLNDFEQYDKMDLVKADGKTPIKLYYIGHCAEASIYKDWGYRNNKEYDIMLVGCLGKHYPLRARFHKLLPIFEKKGYRVHIHPHPGYDLQDAYTDRYQIEFAQTLNKTKIALTDTGLPKSRYGKYIEIPACATLLAGDIPGDKTYKNYEADDFAMYILDIDLNESDDDIIEKIEHYLEKEGQDGYAWYQNYIDEGLRFASGYKQENYGDRLYKLL